MVNLPDHDSELFFFGSFNAFYSCTICFIFFSFRVGQRREVRLREVYQRSFGDMMIQILIQVMIQEVHHLFPLALRTLTKVEGLKLGPALARM